MINNLVFFFGGILAGFFTFRYVVKWEKEDAK